MTFTQLGDDFNSRPEVLTLSDAAYRLHISALIYGNTALTDGFIPTAAVNTFHTVEPDKLALIAELLNAELWETVDGGYRVEWRDQETADRVRKRKEENNRRNQLYRDRKADREQKHQAGDHSSCNPKYCNSLRDASRDPSRDASRDALNDATHPSPTQPRPTQPSPSLPIGIGMGSGDGVGPRTRETEAPRLDGAASALTPRPNGEDSAGHSPHSGATENSQPKKALKPGEFDPVKEFGPMPVSIIDKTGGGDE